ARQHLLDYLVIAESRHEAAEDLIFWPAVRKRVPDGAALADRGLEQEREGKYILDTLRVMPIDQRWWELSDELAQAIREHIAFEEEQVWPALRATTGRLGALVLGAKFSWAERLSPTRPHPRGPDRPLGLFTAGMASALVDRIRDRLTRRRR
ncbi:MAG: hemerythrin domain-containing protein, partial [Pseudonocardiaceae bacterium]